jgi:8-oxo-dGTP pyrophosphatase MutT (NUDIX family)
MTERNDNQLGFFRMLVSHVRRNSVVDRVRLLFGAAPAHIQAAALPWREGPHGIEVMLVTSRDTGRWVLPKGWPEGDEALSETAAREAAEEAGVEGSIAPEESGRYFYGKATRSGLVRRCEVHVYPLKVARLAKKWPEKRNRTRKWVVPREAAAMVNESDLAELLTSFKP